MTGGPVREATPGAADQRVELAIEVNGAPLSIRARPAQRLLDVLRELELYSVRDGCSVGMCGACTVLVDGSAVSSCLTLAGLCDGASIVTAEGLGTAHGLDPVADAFLAGRAFQCSYCTPGFVLAVKALLDEEPRPSRDRVRQWLSGHICRCGSYSRIIDAAMAAAEGTHAGGDDG